MFARIVLALAAIGVLSALSGCGEAPAGLEPYGETITTG